MKLEWGALWWVAHDENVRALPWRPMALLHTLTGCVTRLSRHCCCAVLEATHECRSLWLHVS
jgi:hypothetical protein